MLYALLLAQMVQCWLFDVEKWCTKILSLYSIAVLLQVLILQKNFSTYKMFFSKRYWLFFQSLWRPKKHVNWTKRNKPDGGIVDWHFPWSYLKNCQDGLSQPRFVQCFYYLWNKVLQIYWLLPLALIPVTHVVLKKQCWLGDLKETLQCLNLFKHYQAQSNHHEVPYSIISESDEEWLITYGINVPLCLKTYSKPW